ncbi:hypothetical protein SFHH103_04071 (plasmid) [Sinorhizobium fredii HH103]|uniref:Uncharacterized protein n=1 Tax=Sinorhizobium fredii (strain HH103) TaxID=1117943 RepID=G9ABY2_SINF1|nr:hypothetical protein SFHH103_04071 [Sinorhizobium fredii HH103]
MNVRFYCVPFLDNLLNCKPFFKRAAKGASKEYCRRVRILSNITFKILKYAGNEFEVAHFVGNLASHINPKIYRHLSMLNHILGTHLSCTNFNIQGNEVQETPHTIIIGHKVQFAFVTQYGII